jgi:hypothetical protein
MLLGRSGLNTQTLTCSSVVVTRLFASHWCAGEEASCTHTAKRFLSVSKPSTMACLEFTPSRVHIFKRGATLFGCSEVSLAVAMSCLMAVVRSVTELS